EVVQTLGMADAVLGRWQARHAEAVARQAPAVARSAAMTALTRMTRQAVQVGMLALGAWLVVTHAASPGVMIATTVLLGRALAPVEQIVASWRVLAEARAAWMRLRRLHASKAAEPAPMPLPSPEGAL